MSKLNSVTSDSAPHMLRDEEADQVTGGVLGPEPLGTAQLFWDPLWWEVGRTGHLPTVSIPR